MNKNAIVVCICLISWQLGACAPTVDMGREGYLSKALDGTYYAKLAKDAGKDEERRTKIDGAYTDMIRGCKEIMSSYEGRADTYRTIALLMAISGAVAGSIVIPALQAAAPLANKTAVTALGGWSGVTNIAQTTMTAQGLTAAEAVNTREGIRKEFRAAMEKYAKAVKENRLDDMESAIVEGTAACMSYIVHSPDVKVKN